MSRAAAAVVAAALLLAGCSSAPPEGKVIDKRMRPGHSVTTMIPICGKTCTYVPTTTHHPPCPQITVVDEAGETSDHCVSEASYEAAEIGKLYREVDDADRH